MGGQKHNFAKSPTAISTNNGVVVLNKLNSSKTFINASSTKATGLYRNSESAVQIPAMEKQPLT